MNLDTVKQHIESWIENFVEVPHTALGGWAPCPYAQQARLNKEYEVVLGHSVTYDLIQLSHAGLNSKQVIIIAYPAEQYTAQEFSYLFYYINRMYLQSQDLIALPDHPKDPEIVNGVAMNQGTYALALVQGLSDLNQRAKAIATKGFYDTWPRDYLQQLFQHREDPTL